MEFNSHRVLYLYKTPSKFYIQPVEQPNEALIIDRQTCDITFSSMFSISLLPANATSCLIYGLIGIKHLSRSSYLIVIAKASQIGFINDEPIYRMDQAQVIPFAQNSTQPSSDQLDWDSIHFGMLESTLKVPHFYFSYSYDLTNTLQRANYRKIQQGFDERFLWNRHLMYDFARCGDVAARYHLPFIHGFVSIHEVAFQRNIRWSIISRRSVKRAGTRYNRRGVDHDGNVANFVETEQIVEDHQQKASFVQIRGTIPLIWNQRVNFRYKPEIEIDYEQDQFISMKKHFEGLLHQYQNVSVVNLIDKTGDEGKMQREFSNKMGELQGLYTIPYHYFDFHKECGKMQWNRLSILIDNLRKELSTYGYFVLRNGNVIQRQSGVVRSNCIDSLDRTNVIQSMIAQLVLEEQLENFQLLSPSSQISSHTLFVNVFKNSWADNADTLSIQYAGTPALKTDLTRTGKRTLVGLVRDGVNASTRYVSNNFFDAYRQDAIDLFLGSYEAYPNALYKPSDLISYTSPLPIPITLVVLTLVILYFYLRY